MRLSISQYALGTRCLLCKSMCSILESSMYVFAQSCMLRTDLPVPCKSFVIATDPASLWEGVDLKDDLSRFQIIAKVPYPNSTENWVKKKMNLFPFWYRSVAMTKLLQGTGRSVRNMQDWAKTYMLDSNIEHMLLHNKHLVPRAYCDMLNLI